MLSLDHPAYVIGGAVEVFGPIDARCLESAIRYTAERHENMRAVIVSDDDEYSLEVRTDCYPSSPRRCFPTGRKARKTMVKATECTSRSKESCSIHSSNCWRIHQSALPLTPSQEAMLYSHISSPASRAYFLQFRIDFAGSIRPELMERAWREVAVRHQALRSVFQHEALESPVQIVRREPNILFVCEEAGADVDSIAARDLDEPLDLTSGPTMRVRLVETAPDRWSLLRSFHHILMDGWCLAIVFSDLFKIYEALRANQMPELPPAPSLGACTEWIRHRDKSNSKAFWKEYLAGCDTATVIPRTANRSGYRNSSHILSLSAGETDALVSASATLGVTLSTLFQTAWGALLAKYNDTNDAVFGVVVSGRPSSVSNIEDTVGAFIMTVPCRVTFEPGTSFGDVSRGLQDDSLAAEQHHWISLADIQASSPLQSNLLDHILVFENYPFDRNLMRNPLSGLQIENVGGVEQIPYDLGVTVVPGDEVQIRFAYNANAYTDQFIETLGTQLRQVLSSVAHDPMSAMNSLPALTPELNEQLRAYNATDANYPADSTIHELIFDQAEQTPDRTAVIIPDMDGEIVLTYSDVATKSRALSKLLHDAGVTPGGSVAVLIDRGEHLVPGLLAVLASGASPIYGPRQHSIQYPDVGRTERPARSRSPRGRASAFD